MEVTILSRDTIKPSVTPTDVPQNLCLFDQLTPSTYPEIILFYPMTNVPSFNITQTLKDLKKSLSQTLTVFYPFSGRVKDNLYIDGFDSGVPYLEARANLLMSDYLSSTLDQHIESLNALVPYKPFCREVLASSPLMAIQVTVFSCGGIALGASLCHKKSDGTTLSHFLLTWADIFSGSPDRGRVLPPNHSEPASLFPPRAHIPESHLTLMDRLWFGEKGDYVTRRFSFGAAALEGLRALGSSEKVPEPTRNEVVSCFIWKHAMAAAAAGSEGGGGGKPRTSIAAHAVNVRPRMKSRARALKSCTGNLFWWAAVATGCSGGSDTSSKEELSRLVELTREVMSALDEDYLEAMVGVGGFEPVSEFLSQLGAMLSAEVEKPHILAFTNWKGFFNDVDFGWGPPVWVGAHGKVGDEFRNMVVLIDKQSGSGKEIEAVVTLEERHMAVLEKDREFLAFASSPTELVALSDRGLVNSRM